MHQYFRKYQNVVVVRLLLASSLIVRADAFLAQVSRLVELQRRKPSPITPFPPFLIPPSPLLIRLIDHHPARHPGLERGLPDPLEAARSKRRPAVSLSRCDRGDDPWTVLRRGREPPSPLYFVRTFEEASSTPLHSWGLLRETL